MGKGGGGLAQEGREGPVPVPLLESVLDSLHLLQEVDHGSPLASSGNSRSAAHAVRSFLLLAKGHGPGPSPHHLLSRLLPPGQ